MFPCQTREVEIYANEFSGSEIYCGDLSTEFAKQFKNNTVSEYLGHLSQVSVLKQDDQAKAIDLLRRLVPKTVTFSTIKTKQNDFHDVVLGKAAYVTFLKDKNEFAQEMRSFILNKMNPVQSVARYVITPDHCMILFIEKHGYDVKITFYDPDTASGPIVIHALEDLGSMLDQTVYFSKLYSDEIPAVQLLTYEISDESVYCPSAETQVIYPDINAIQDPMFLHCLLYFSIENNDVDAVKRILEHPLMIAFKQQCDSSDSGTNYLFRALQNGYHPIAHMLLHHPGFKLSQNELSQNLDLHVRRNFAAKIQKHYREKFCVLFLSICENEDFKMQIDEEDDGFEIVAFIKQKLSNPASEMTIEDINELLKLLFSEANGSNLLFLQILLTAVNATPKLYDISSHARVDPGIRVDLAFFVQNGLFDTSFFSGI